MIGFILLALALLGCAAAVITTRDLVSAVLWLGLTLVITAGAYVALEADFLAAIQLMLYTGGVITLMLFAVMLTERLEGAKVEVTSATWHRGVIAAISFNAIAAWAIAKSELPGGAQTGVNALTAPDTQALGELFLTRHVAAFEALSALLLAAMIGAIVLARKKDAK